MNNPIDLVKKQSRDANAWARSFMEIMEAGNPQIDHGLMRAWFASAMRF